MPCAVECVVCFFSFQLSHELELIRHRIPCKPKPIECNHKANMPSPTIRQHLSLQPPKLEPISKQKSSLPIRRRLLLPQIRPDGIKGILRRPPSLLALSLAHLALDPLHLGLDVLALVRDLVALFLRRPEARHRESVL